MRGNMTGHRRGKKGKESIWGKRKKCVGGKYGKCEGKRTGNMEGKLGCKIINFYQNVYSETSLCGSLRTLHRLRASHISRD